MEKIKKLLLELNINTTNFSLYETALTHASYVNENGGQHYDRLEFLGDSLFDMIVADFVFKEYPEANSGLLSKTRSYLVRGEMQAYFAKKFGIDKLIRYSVGEQKNIKHHSKIEEDVFEAFLGAMYLDQGLDFVKDFLYKLYKPLLSDAINQAQDMKTDPKSTLQEKLGSSKVKYVIVKQRNNQIEDDEFIVEARSEGILLGVGSGHNHNEAEKNAALDALNKGV